MELDRVRSHGQALQRSLHATERDLEGTRRALAETEAALAELRGCVRVRESVCALSMYVSAREGGRASALLLWHVCVRLFLARPERV